MDFKKIDLVTNRKGFTLIELMAVMVIMGVMVSVAIKKFDLLSDNASIIAIEAGIRELKLRESVTWFKIKLSDTGYINDVDVYNAIDKNLGQGYIWNPDPDISGGRLHFKSQSVDLNRAPSTPNSPASWL
ncbi:MAG: prepilin-type N-terminal cleavage/methylation domain-containing protein [Cyclobacteriaceae bacterium]|nr:prepilin-type N-terminal cleavage/methylation domain-containing protein [Cyclobacteriaceae bacterium]